MGHELSHAYDANNNFNVAEFYDNVPKREWAAIYKENLMRNELNLPYRTYYQSNGKGYGLGPRMIQNGEPYLPFPYPGIK